MIILLHISKCNPINSKFAKRDQLYQEFFYNYMSQLFRDDVVIKILDPKLEVDSIYNNAKQFGIGCIFLHLTANNQNFNFICPTICANYNYQKYLPWNLYIPFFLKICRRNLMMFNLTSMQKKLGNNLLKNFIIYFCIGSGLLGNKAYSKITQLLNLIKKTNGKLRPSKLIQMEKQSIAPSNELNLLLYEKENSFLVGDWLDLIDDLPGDNHINKLSSEYEQPTNNPYYIFDVSTLSAEKRGWFKASGQLYSNFFIYPDDIVVDVGCGAGGQTLYSAKQGAHVVAVDCDLMALKNVETQLKKLNAGTFDIIQSDCAPLSLADNYATKIICTEVLEHVDSPQNLLAELYRIGKPGALYLLAVPGPESEYLQKNCGAPASCFEKPNHIRIIEREEFQQMVESAGLKIESYGYGGFYMAIYVAFFWICKSYQESLLTEEPLGLNWARTWHLFVDLPNSLNIIDELDTLLPKSQYIVAKKLETSIYG